MMVKLFDALRICGAALALLVSPGLARGPDWGGGGVMPSTITSAGSPGRTDATLAGVTLDSRGSLSASDHGGGGYPVIVTVLPPVRGTELGGGGLPSDRPTSVIVGRVSGGDGARLVVVRDERGAVLGYVSTDRDGWFVIMH